jgi:hypothetical protein
VNDLDNRARLVSALAGGVDAAVLLAACWKQPAAS